jgi:hypothetical protein
LQACDTAPARQAFEALLGSEVSAASLFCNCSCFFFCSWTGGHSEENLHLLDKFTVSKGEDRKANEVIKIFVTSLLPPFWAPRRPLERWLGWPRKGWNVFS